ncbi:amino acid adenylation domain-containing protein [Waterburya agarophytonicola K14]|uniref:Amino acid adenylation domain-containing protein n=1 Tax=Waterburya agarophytonicola KI4 TaxID=2874699 RepID=A0A964FDU5_9CYAN|nr:non-ribosomal peptide synthetase [Waterburya agarophytonicola]MCC0175466.1 amino acid adenylation domain-containing protein [Waterburya agarophytonicola KI4]
MKNNTIYQSNKLTINYWQKQLEDIAPILNFPTDKLRALNFGSKEKNQSDFKQYSTIISAELTIAVKDFARQEKIPLKTIFLVAFKVLLYRYTSQNNIVVGCLDWYRDRQSNKLAILPVKVEVAGNDSFSELLASTQAQISTTEEHLDLNIDALSQALKQENPEFSVASISQMLFRFFTSSSTTKTELGKTVFPRELCLEIIDDSLDMKYQIEYDSDLYHQETIARISCNYQILLESLIANPQAAIASLALISKSEQDKVLFEWNQTQIAEETNCIHQLFEARVVNNPEALAIVCQGKELTYQELNQKANQVAHYLKSLGITKGSLVGLYLERSVTMVVGLLGIIKTGAAYVPLDLGNPQPRQAFILEDAGVSVLLTQASLLDKIPSQIEHNICLDRDWNEIAQFSPDNCGCEVTASDLALIVYTSGSTGKPKGVMITHGNLSHYANSMHRSLNVTSEDVYLHRGQVALIASARQLLMPLTQGAGVVILTEPEKRDPFLMFDTIKRYGVTIVDRVPSFWLGFSDIFRQLDQETKQSIQDNRVRLVATSGEQVALEVYDCWRETFGDRVKLVNLYGQTEGTGVVTVYHVPQQLDRSFKSLPVGSPIGNMRVYLLDEYLKPVPIGVVAQIHISGAGVAKGYLNRPELTAEKFIANPFVEGERLYKTGDLGRYLAALKDTASHNGSIQFLGRIDRQVNIQGLRIELGEIEAILSQNELIQEAAVVVRQNKLGETLAVYLVPTQTPPPSVEILTNYLRQKLPTYMIPQEFIFVDKFPVTTSGKVDRIALSAGSQTEISTSIIAPRDRLESELVQLLQDILGIDRISIRDNFIELGGNSLLAARLVTEIEAKYEQKIAVSTVFQAQNIENLATLIRQEESLATPECLVPIKQGNSTINLFAIHNLGYGLEFYLPLAKYLDSNIAIQGLSSFLSNELDKPHPRDIRGLAAYYTRNLQQVQPQGPYYLLGVSFGGVIAYEIAQLLVSQGEEVKFLGMVDSFFPNRNEVRKYLPIKERFKGHINKTSSQGINHVLNRLKWRIEYNLNTIQAKLHEIDWIRDNFIDRTSRNFAIVENIRWTNDHAKVNKDYAIEPYPGKISMFRAADDMDSKLDWQKLAQAGLAIYDVPGEHLSVLQEPHVRILAEKMQSVLQEYL